MIYHMRGYERRSCAVQPDLSLGCTSLARVSDVPTRAVSTFESCQTRFGSPWPKLGEPRVEIAQLVMGDSLTQLLVFLGIVRVADQRRFGKQPARLNTSRSEEALGFVAEVTWRGRIHHPRNVNEKIFRSKFATVVV